jgi:Tfp pilus assembly protein PilX
VIVEREKQNGFMLVTVVVTLFLIAAIAVLLSHSSAMGAHTAVSELAAVRAEYVARAGMQHALWKLRQQQGCGPYTDIVALSLGEDSYTTTLTTDLGSTSSVTINVDQDTWIRSDQPTTNKAGDSKLHIRFQLGNIERPMYRYDVSSLAPNAAILSATAWFYVSKEHAAGPVDIHLLNADWSESDATWATMGANMDSVVLATIPSQPTPGVWVALNLTPQVQAWVNGQPNYGITLDSTSEGSHGDYSSREASQQPYIDVILAAPPSATATLVSVGTLANGLSRNLSRQPLKLYQSPPRFASLKPGVGLNDTGVVSNVPGQNDGSLETLLVSDASVSAYGLMHFTTLRVPWGARIQTAELVLNLVSVTATQPGSVISVHRMLNDWTEDSATYAAPRPSGSWAWPDTYASKPVDSVAFDSPAPGFFRWDVTALLQGWVDGTFDNQGLVLASSDGVDAIRFSSGDGLDASLHPRLEITYSCECGQVCVAPQGSGRIVMIGDYAGFFPDARDRAKKDIFESWGYVVDIRSDNFIWLINFDNYDVVYVSQTARSGSVTGQLDYRSIGIINEQGDLNSDLGIASGSGTTAGKSVNIFDNSHYVTAYFATGAVATYSGEMELLTATGPMANGLQTLATVNSTDSLVLLEAGATTLAGPAAGRRVTLPLGRTTDASFNWDYMNANGRLLVQRAIQWGTGNVAGVVSVPIFLSTSSAAKLGGLSFDDIDLAEYDLASDSASLFFEGALAFLERDIDALHLLANGHIVLSTDNDSDLGGLSFRAGDLVDYDPATDTATLFFDGAAFSDVEDIRSVYITDKNHILLSTDSDAKLGGLSFTDNDLVDYDTDSDTATLFFDGSAVSLISDIDAVHLLDNGHIVLSTADSASLGGLSFSDGDLVDYDPISDTAALYFDEALFSNNEDIISTHIGAGSGKIVLPKKVYWTDDNARLIQRSNDNGSDIETVVSDQDSVRGLDIDTVNGKIYWTTGGSIRRANLDGSNIETVFSDSFVNLDIKLDVAAGKMYWTHDFGVNDIMRADLDGSNSEVINTLLQAPAYLTLDTTAGYLYVTEFSSGSVSRMNLDGSASIKLIDGPAGATGNALDPAGGKIFWSGGASNDWIKRANLDGSGEETIVSGLNAPQDIAYDADSDRIYWTDGLNRVVQRANSDGSKLETIVTGLVRPRGIVLLDVWLLPPGGSSGGGGANCEGTFRDQFESKNWDGSSGSIDWSSPWVEVGESNGPSSGDIQIRADTSNFQLRTRDNDNGGEGVQREIDLSGAGSATLSYDYRRVGLDSSSDYTTVEVSADGPSGPWTELLRHQGPSNDSSYQSIIHDISAYSSAQTHIRFKTSASMGNTDTVWFDNIEVECKP